MLMRAEEPQPPPEGSEARRYDDLARRVADLENQANLFQANFTRTRFSQWKKEVDGFGKWKQEVDALLLLIIAGAFCFLIFHILN